MRGEAAEAWSRWAPCSPQAALACSESFSWCALCLVLREARAEESALGFCKIFSPVPFTGGAREEGSSPWENKKRKNETKGGAPGRDGVRTRSGRQKGGTVRSPSFIPLKLFFLERSLKGEVRRSPGNEHSVLCV